MRQPAPSHCRLMSDFGPSDWPFWNGVLRARARDEWGDVSLVVAAQLARCQNDIESESLLLENEGTVVVNMRGSAVANPRVAVLEQLARREMALMRTLRMGGEAAGDRRNEAGRRKAQTAAEKIQAEIGEEDDELLAKP